MNVLILDFNTLIVLFLFLPEFIFFSFSLSLLLFNLLLSSNKNNIIFYPNMLRVNSYFICLIIAIVLVNYLSLVSYEFSFYNFSLISNYYIVILKFIIFFFSFFLVLYFYFYLKLKNIIKFEFFYLFISIILSLILVLNANDLILFFLLIEIYNLLIYSLIGLRKNSNFSLEASIKYFIYSAVITGIFLFSISLIYSATGCTNYYDLDLFLWFPVYGSNLSNLIITFGFYLFILALFAKISFAPFHFWLVDIYEGAPLPITFFLSFLPKIVYFSIFIRLISNIFSSLYFLWIWLFIIFFIFSLIIGVLGSLYQVKLKRIIIFSTVANSGFFLIPFIININYNYIFLFYFILIYSINLIGIFYVLLALINFSSYMFYKNLVNIKNLSLLNPYLSFCFSIFIFSISGLPPFAGFFPKIYLLLDLVGSGWFYLFIFTLIFSSISFFYYIRIIKLIFFNNFKIYLFLKPITFFHALIISFFTIFNLIFIFFSGDLIYLLFDFVLLF